MGGGGTKRGPLALAPAPKRASSCWGSRMRVDITLPLPPAAPDKKFFDDSSTWTLFDSRGDGEGEARQVSLLGSFWMPSHEHEIGSDLQPASDGFNLERFERFLLPRTTCQLASRPLARRVGSPNSPPS